MAELAVIRETCPNLAQHQKTPTGYIGWHAWAEEMSVSHVQEKCPGCDLWAIWTAKPDRSPSAAKARATRLLNKWSKTTCVNIPRLPRR